MRLQVGHDHVPYDVWEKQGCLMTTEGNIIYYGFIENFIDDLGKKFHIREISFDRWGAVQMVRNLEGLGFTVVPFGQGLTVPVYMMSEGFWCFKMRGFMLYCEQKN